MRTIKVFGFQQTAPNQFTFTGQELEKLLNQMYKEGYNDGRSSLTVNTTSPLWETVAIPCNGATSIKYENPCQTTNQARPNLTNGDTKCE